MAIEIANLLHAFASMSSVGAVASFLRNLGFVSVVRNGVGDYTFTLVQGVDFLESTISITSLGNTTLGAFSYQTQRATPETIRILSRDAAGLFADSDFEMQVWSLPVRDL
jgi:hypothetical protein